MRLIKRIQFYFKSRRARKEFGAVIEEANQIKATALDNLQRYRKDTDNLPNNMKEIVRNRMQIKEANDTIALAKEEYKELFGKTLNV